MTKLAFVHSPERNLRLLRFVRLNSGGNTVVGRNYLTRQATTLLKFAQSTSDPKLVAALVEKAADLKSQIDETTPPPDPSPRAPDVEPSA
jgi:hypothetical protein